MKPETSTETSTAMSSSGSEITDIEMNTHTQDETQANVITGLEIPDKFSGHGLMTLISCWIFNITTWGSNSGFSIYLAHYLNTDTFKGTQKVEYGILGGLTFAAGLTFAPFINFMIGKIGLKVTLSIGLVIQFAGVLLASFSTKYWQICLTQGVLQGIGMALSCIANINLLPQWFRKKRNLAVGITASGSGIGGIIFTVGMQELLNKHGFRWSLRTQAIICAVGEVIAIILAKSRDAHIKPVFKVFDKLIWSNFGLWCLLSFTVFTLLGYVVLMYNLADFTMSLGYSSSDGSIVSMMISIGIIFGRPTVGFLSDRFGSVLVGSIVSLLVSIFSFAMWIPARNLVTAIFFALIVGGLMGSIWVISAPICTTVAGLKKMGLAMAVFWIFVGVSGFVSPIIGIVLKSGGSNTTDPTEYRDPAIFVGLCYFMASVSLFVLRLWLTERHSVLLELQESAETKFENIEDTNLQLTVSVSPIRAMKQIYNYSVKY